MVVGIHKFWASLISHEGFAIQPLTNRNYKKTLVFEELQLGLLILGISTKKKGIMKIIGWKMKLARVSLSIKGEVLNREGTTNLYLG